ncbi:MAG: hypothetical protein OXI80_18920 [Caldilineaceae bacterium]|nr:hypothetical protein [Caldilineaceae bacterium]MDE0339753.1 hypothetical protein [Caldilineaceae bacterium]
MRVLRFTVPIILFAVILVGCIVQADTYSDQNPFSAPDTLQSSNNSTLPSSAAGPAPTLTPAATLTPAPRQPRPTPTPKPLLPHTQTIMGRE